MNDKVLRVTSPTSAAIDQQEPGESHPRVMNLTIPSNNNRLVIGFSYGKNSMSLNRHTLASLLTLLRVFSRDRSFKSLMQPKHPDPPLRCLCIAKGHHFAHWWFQANTNSDEWWCEDSVAGEATTKELTVADHPRNDPEAVALINKANLINKAKGIQLLGLEPRNDPEAVALINKAKGIQP